LLQKLIIIVEEDKVYEVVYFSRGGNTKKVAEAMAAELGTKARDVRAVDGLSKDSLVLLGTGCYGAVLAKDIADFIDRNGLQGRKIVLFTTSLLGLGKEVSIMEKQIRDKGVEITSSFNCFGSFLGMKKQHPDAGDLVSARTFARMMVVTEQNTESKIQPVPETAGAAV
jgi:flavodoxin